MALLQARVGGLRADFAGGCHSHCAGRQL